MKIRLSLGSLLFASFALSPNVWSEPAAPKSDVAPKLKTVAIKECVRITPGETLRQRNLVLLPLDIEVRKSLATCGCTTPLISYKVMEPVKQRMVELSRGTIDSRPRQGRVDQIFLVLNHDGLVPVQQPLEVYFGCTGG